MSLFDGAPRRPETVLRNYRWRSGSNASPRLFFIGAILLFGLLAVAGDQPWAASPEAKGLAGSTPNLVAYFVSWHATERGSSNSFEYTGRPAFPQEAYEEITHRMSLEMKGSAIERFRADNGEYFDIHFLTVTLRQSANVWMHEHDSSGTTPPRDCFLSVRDIIIDPAAYSEFRADPESSGGTWDLLGGEPDRHANDQLENSFLALGNMRFTERWTLEGHGSCPQSSSNEGQFYGVAPTNYDFPVFSRPTILHADPFSVSYGGKRYKLADRTSFSLNRHFSYTTFFSPAGNYIRTPGGGEKRDVTWTAHAYRMGKCAGHDSPIPDDDPVIQDEKVDLDANRTEVNATPPQGGEDQGMAQLTVTLTCERVPIKNAEVQVNVDPVDESGGHIHSDDNRPRGKVNGAEVPKNGVTLKAKTDADGKIKFKYAAPLTGFVDQAGYGNYDVGIAGIYRVTAKSIRRPEATTMVAITSKVDGLADLPDNPNYVSVRGDNGGHPGGSYGTPQTLGEFRNLGNDFSAAEQDHEQQLQQCQKPKWFNTPVKVSLNDIALPDGGIFDLDSGWQPGHYTHNKGEGGDFNRFTDISGTGKDCNSTCICTSVNKRTWLLHTLLELGEAYGKWDCKDLGNPPGCATGEPPTSVGYIPAHPQYPHRLHLHVQDARE